MNPKEDVMKCCDSREERVTREESRTKLSGLAQLGIIGAILTCVACFTLLAVALLGVIGLAGWVGYLDCIFFPLLALFAGLLVIGLVRHRSDAGKLKGES